MPAVRTRFAPSPTGYMHIGGMRTALFNWLWARHSGGQFVLRIDDTDRQRNLDEALAPILRAFQWLGLTWDEGPEIGGPHGPYFQSQRDHLYRAAADRLLAAGQAYRCFDPPEQIKADREAAEREKRQYVNIRRSLELTPQQIADYEAQGRPYVVRFLVPRDRKIAVDDAVRGRVEWDCSLMSDPVILRADGTPLYNFATVVDDAAMQITHVIRAEEHLSNTPPQVLMHEALGNALPQFAHIPFITAPGSTKKLSKRDVDKLRNNPQLKKLFDRADVVLPQIGVADSSTINPVMVEYYERMGWLPKAVLNGLARLGWSLDDRTEIMSLDTVVENFTLDRVVKSPAALDADKLLSYQAHWMGQLSLDERVAGCLPFLLQAGFIPEQAGESLRNRILAVVRGMEDRLKVFSDILDYTEFLVADHQLTWDEKNFRKRFSAPEAIPLLEKFRGRLEAAGSFEAGALEELLRQFVEDEGIKIAQIIHPLRLAVTGKSTGIGMYDCLAILGRDACLARIDRAVSRARAAAAGE